jgi:RNA polymerase sigma-70 factor (ECF subfamily)
MLSRLYGPLVYRWVRQRGLRDHDAADVVQNVFLSVFRSIGKLSLQGPNASFRGWLWTITRNAVREWARQRETQPPAVGGDEGNWSLQPSLDPAVEADPLDTVPLDADAEQSLANRALLLVRQSLDDRTWEAFRRTALENHTASEVATDLGMTPKAVRQAKYRVLMRLRELLADA